MPHASRSLIVNVAELLRRPSSRKSVQLTSPAHGMVVMDSRVPDGADIDVDLELESLPDGIVVTGHLAAPWEGVCRRCLQPVSSWLDVSVGELYQRTQTIEDARPIEGEQLDLEPLVREAVVLELPLAPLCREDCAGLCPFCGADRNEIDCGHHTTPTDSRWDVLDDLRSRLDPKQN